MFRHYTDKGQTHKSQSKDTSSTYKALSSIIHQAKLEALLILKGFSKGVTQAVGGEHALSALLKLAEDAL